MINIFTENKTISLSVSDGNGKLSYTGALNLFMDIASFHEEALGCGIKSMEKEGSYWIIGKTRVKFVNRPSLMDEVTIKTYLLKPQKLFVNREYLIEDLKGNPLVLGESEWLIYDKNNKKLMPISSYLSEEYPKDNESLFEDNNKKPKKDFCDKQYIGEYKVLPIDIDYIGHMNNTAYSKLIFSFLSNEELKRKEIVELNIYYNKQCLENELLKVYKREEANKLEFGAFNEDENVMLASLCFM